MRVSGPMNAKEVSFDPQTRLPLPDHEDTPLLQLAESRRKCSFAQLFLRDVLLAVELAATSQPPNRSNPTYLLQSTDRV